MDEEDDKQRIEAYKLKVEEDLRLSRKATETMTNKEKLAVEVSKAVGDAVMSGVELGDVVNVLAMVTHETFGKMLTRKKVSSIGEFNQLHEIIGEQISEKLKTNIPPEENKGTK